MNERKKLQESRYFLSRMKQEQENRFDFTCNLSGFLSASRSILQYAYAEAKRTRNGLQWYELTVSNEPILQFFKDKRDINIHEQPISPSAKINVAVHETIGISDSISVVVKDKDGNIKHEYCSKPSQTPIETTPPEATKTITYYFSDWIGNEDLVTLCEKYLDKLEKLINDGVSRGHISG